MAEPGRQQNMIKCGTCIFHAARATDTHSEYIILIVFPRQEW